MELSAASHHKMAKLRRSKADGHYYVQQNIFGTGIATYQIKQQGVDFLGRKGIGIGDEIPVAYFKRLRNAGFAYTGGSGVGVLNSAKFSSNPDLGFEKVTFVLKESATRWNFAIYVPELPQDVMARVDSCSLITKLSLKINESSVPIVRLWPGKGGTAVDLEPSLKPFRFELVGPWPSINLPRFPKDLLICAEGERFLVTSQNARLIHRHAPMELGSTYILLTRVPLPGKDAPEDIEDVAPDVLRKRGWFLSRFTIPETPTEELARWCVRLGYALQEKAWKLSLLSPPPVGYSDDATAIIKSDNLIVTVKKPESGTKQLDLVLQRASDAETSLDQLQMKLGASESAGFINFRLPKPGTYVLRGINTWVSPLPIRFDPASTIAEASPPPFRVMVKEHYIEGISQSTEPTEVVVASPECPLKVVSAVPLMVEWGTRYLEFETADKANEFLWRAWSELFDNRRSEKCRISAGNFGSATLHLAAKICTAAHKEVGSNEMRGFFRRLRLREGALYASSRGNVPRALDLLIPVSMQRKGADQQRARLIYRKLLSSEA
jgi:hypothetical protein